MPSARILVEFAAWFHLLQIPGTLYLSRRVVCLTRELSPLPPLIRAIMAVFGGAFVILLVALGVLIGAHPDDALGSGLGASLIAFLGGFWLLRLVAQAVYFHCFPWPRTAEGWAAHLALCSIFLAQAWGYLEAWHSR
jgi:hypothetical protein